MAIKVEVETAPESGAWNDYTSIARLDTLQVVSQGASDAGTAQVSFTDAAGTAVILPECGLRVSDGALVVFRGKIKKRGKTERMVQQSARRKEYAITAQDATSLLVDDIVDTGGLRTTVEGDAARIIWLITTYGTKGVTAATTGGGGFVQSIFTPLPEQDFTGLNLFEAISEVLKFSGGRIFVDNNLALHHFVSETNSAPFNLSDAPNNVTTFGYSGFNFPDDSLELVNAVFVIGAGGVGEWVTDATSIATYGRKEGAFEDATLETSAARIAAGNAILTTRKAPRGPISFRVFKEGLRAGMTIQITNSIWGLTAVTYRIAEVTATVFGNVFIYDVSLQDAPITLHHYVATELRTINRDVRRSTNAAIDYAEQFLIGRVRVVAALPTLPDVNYPIAAQVFLTSDEKLYRNVDEAWTKAVDGLDIIADTVTAGAIAAGAIGAEALAAEIVLADKLLTTGPDGTQHVEISDEGVTLFDAAGGPVVRIPTDPVLPVFVKGDVEAGSLTSHLSATFEGTAALAKAATMTLEANVAAPTQAPVLTAGYQQLAAGLQTGIWGLTFDGTYMCAPRMSGGGADGPVEITRYNATTGAINDTIATEVELSGAIVSGLAFGGSHFWLLTWHSNSDVRIWKITTAGVVVSQTNVATHISGTKTQAGLFYDATATRLVLVTTTGTGASVQIRFRLIDPSTMGLSSTVDATGFTVNGASNGFPGGARVGTDYWVNLYPGPAPVKAFTASTGAAIANTEWGYSVAGAHFATAGIAHDGTQFHFRTNTVLYKTTNWTWTTESAKYWAAYSWYDPDVAGTGQHETTVGPRASVTMYRRMQLQITNAAIPGAGGDDDPDNVRIYLARNATDPGAGNYKLQTTSSATSRTLLSFNDAGAADPTSNNFPGATPAALESADEGWILRGNGSMAFGRTSFPAGAVAGDHCYRSDIGMWFRYNGTRWLCTCLHSQMVERISGTAFTGSSSSIYAGFPHFAGGSDIWIEEIYTTFFVASGGTALGASHKWEGTMAGLPSGATVGGTIFSIASGASNVWRQATVHNANFLLGADSLIRVAVTKTGTPGDLEPHINITFRVVAT